MSVVEEIILCHKSLADLNEFDYHLVIKRHSEPRTNSLYFLYKFVDKFGNIHFQSDVKNYYEVLYYTVMTKIQDIVGGTDVEINKDVQNIKSKFKTNVEDFMFKLNKSKIIVTYS